MEIFCALATATIHILISWIRADNFLGHQISEIETISNETENIQNIQDRTAVIIENIEFITASNGTWPSTNSSKINSLKKIPIIFFEKFNPQNLLRPVQQKWKEIQDLLTYPFHPNYGGLILSSPQHIFSKLKEKGSLILEGAHNSIFGIAHPPPDYPFPYKRTGKK